LFPQREHAPLRLTVGRACGLLTGTLVALAMIVAYLSLMSADSAAASHEIANITERASRFNDSPTATTTAPAKTLVTTSGIERQRASGLRPSTTAISPNSAAKAERGGLNLFKWKDATSTTASGWREGDRMLTVPLKGSPKATWAENSSRLRKEMRSGEPIFESYVDSAGNQIPTKGFLNAERNLLSNRGWQHDPRTRAWTPPR
jgi:hypothetical protein